jgi:small subunit ribosomal protein S17
MSEKARGKKRILTGIVVSDKMNKTVVVAVERKIQHPVYKKFIRTQSKFTAHDERDECQSGDRVTIIESRPLSKTKRWRVMRIVEKQKLSE